MGTPPEGRRSGSSTHRLEASAGWCAREVEEELPGLGVASVAVDLPAALSPLSSAPQPLRDRLATLADRFNGARAIAVRREPVPSAYRVFFRHMGIDPDSRPTPIEAAVRQRLMDGGFFSRNLLEDALLVSLVDTGVPVWALDADAVDGPLGIRLSGEGETLGDGREAHTLEAGRLVLADSVAALAVLFERPARSCGVQSRSRRVVLYALEVPGVPIVCVEEALWICRSTLVGSG